MNTEELLKYSNSISVPNTRMHMKEFHSLLWNMWLKFNETHCAPPICFSLNDFVRFPISNNRF
jgi:hypothetical protein